jgi:signal transduction histidine kinase
MIIIILDEETIILIPYSMILFPSWWWRAYWLRLIMATQQPDHALLLDIEADDKRRHQILINLLDNRVKFTPQVGQ